MMMKVKVVKGKAVKVMKVMIKAKKVMKVTVAPGIKPMTRSLLSRSTWLRSLQPS